MENYLVTKEYFISKGGGPFSIAVANIDNFESINKLYGYPIGDGVIKRLLSVFSQNLAGIDLMTRHGDEFNFPLVKKGTERSFGVLWKRAFYPF